MRSAAIPTQRISFEIGSDGSLLGVPGDFLFNFGGSTATFSNAKQVAKDSRSSGSTGR